MILREYQCGCVRPDRAALRALGQTRDGTALFVCQHCRVVIAPDVEAKTGPLVKDRTEARHEGVKQSRQAKRRNPFPSGLCSIREDES